MKTVLLGNLFSCMGKYQVNGAYSHYALNNGP